MPQRLQRFRPRPRRPWLVPPQKPTGLRNMLAVSYIVGPQTAAHNAAFIQMQNAYIIQQNMMHRLQIFVPPQAAVAQVVKGLVQAPHS